MSGNQPPEAPSEEDNPGFPVIGDYDLVPGPGDPDYVEPPTDEELEDALDGNPEDIGGEEDEFDDEQAETEESDANE